jgi:molybdate transport repressor ModE-like protein
MNNLAGDHLVLRALGGRSGGSASLTARAQRLIDVREGTPVVAIIKASSLIVGTFDS